MMKNNFYVWTKLTKLLKKMYSNAFLGVLYGCFGKVCVMMIYIFGVAGVAKILNPESNILSLTWIIVILSICTVLRGVFQYLEESNNHCMSYSIIGILRNEVFKKLRELYPSRYDEKDSKTVFKELTKDINAFEFIYSKYALPLSVSVIVELGVFIFVSIYANIYLALIALAFYLILGILVPYINSKILKKDIRDRNILFEENRLYFTDTLNGINDICENNISQDRRKKMEVRNESLYMADRRVRVKNIYCSTSYSIIVLISIIFILFVGYICAKYYNLSPTRTFIAMVTIIATLSSTIALKDIPSYLEGVYGSAKRIIALLDEKSNVEVVTTANEFKFETLETRDISFDYHGKKILSHVDLNVKKGEIIGIHPSRDLAGESTILKLLLRMYDITDGNIFYNNIDIKRINTESLKDNVTMVSKSTYMFGDTLLNNLLIGKKDASLEEVRKACKMALLDDFISTLEKGYDTEVETIRDELTSSVKERIGLARAYLSGSPLILLDNICANADSIGQGLILRSIREMSKERTFVFLSYKKAPLKICDRVYNIKEGEFLEREYNVIMDDEN